MTQPNLSTRAGLARAITLIESRRADHQKQARDLLSAAGYLLRLRWLGGR